jgi:hypothetical protein
MMVVGGDNTAPVPSETVPAGLQEYDNKVIAKEANIKRIYFISKECVMLSSLQMYANYSN